jgi:hypothetical protein
MWPILTHVALSSFQAGFSLINPHKLTDVGEIGNWTIRGSALSMRHFIRLTSAHSNRSGAICSRVPTSFRDWKVELELNAFGGTGGKGFYFSFSSDLCPNPETSFDGFSVWIDSKDNRDSWGYYPLFANRSNLTILRSLRICSVPLRSDDSHLRLLVERNNCSVVISYTSTDSHWDDDFIHCGTEKFEDLPDFGYFTITALTNDNLTDDHDLYSVETDALSAIVPPQSLIDFSSRNRKILDEFALDRYPRKIPRQAGLPLMIKYIQKPEELTFSDALRLVDEIISRAMMTVSNSFISHFLNTTINESIEIVRDRIECAADSFHSLKAGLDRVSSCFRNELADITRELTAQVDVVRRDVVAYANILGTGGRDSRLYQAAIRGASHKIRDPLLTNILWGICLIETVAYVLFFLVRVQRTRGFKKAD